ncbi:hypothetical protein [Paraburkholderia susongensis]|uniref:hypothetical protein n=1 Tax=Paraburkholderia susongensis TaxID=1515439 RepID=UPI00117D1B16|nr:hypothetical protein [Paraburkholderia susongensis]
MKKFVLGAIVGLSSVSVFAQFGQLLESVKNQASQAVQTQATHATQSATDEIVQGLQTQVHQGVQSARSPTSSEQGQKNGKSE